MSSADVAVIVVGTIAALSVTVTSYLRLIQERENVRQQRYRMELELRQQDQAESASAPLRAGEIRDLRNLLRHQTDLIRELAVRPITVNVEANTASPPAGTHRATDDPSRASDLAGTESLIREMSHSLNTPLSQVEIALSLLSDSSAGMSVDDRASLQRAMNSVAVCKAFIQAFRYVVLADRDGVDDFAGASLADVLSSAVMSQASEREVEVLTKLPDQIGHYKDAFLLAMLLPLVENAVESSSPGDRVYVASEEGAENTVITVQNHLDSPPSDSMFEPRFSTKADHDGMGLVVVTRLLNSVPDATLTHDWHESTMTFRIELPR